MLYGGGKGFVYDMINIRKILVELSKRDAH
jgi:hypothetical protein